jgi:large subunit ribosomal protein L24
MSTIKKIVKGDIVKIISGSKKGTTGAVLAVLTKKNAVLVEGVGNIHRHVKPSQLNPRGGHKDIHKVALVIDEKTTKTSRVGLVRTVEGGKSRVARQNKDKEIK